MQTRLTKAGMLLLGLVALLYLAALTSQSGLLLTLVGIMVGCLVVNVGVAAWGVRGLRLEAPKSIYLSESQRLWQPWRLLNRGRAPAALLEIGSPAGLLFRVAWVAPGQELGILPDLVYERRGVFPHGQMRIASSYPFGLARAARAVDLTGEVVVGPAVYEVETPRAAGYDVMLGGKHKGNRRSPAGLYFAGVRPLQSGDPLKQIHWRSSAKGQGLMVKTFDEELSGRVAFIVDAGHSGDARILDDGVRALASLLFAALSAGHHAAWIDLVTQELRLVPPFADGQEVLEDLARVALCPGCLTPANLERALSAVPRKGAVHFVLSDFNAAAAAAVARLRAQHRVVCVYLPAEVAPSLAPEFPVGHYTAKGVTMPW